jgi:release factor glutamine methyltransferase
VLASISELLQQARNTLADSASAARDAEILLCHVLACERTYLYTWPDKAVDAATEKSFLELIAARAEGTPVAYLTGEREFWSLSFKVTRDTLIPRPETELLVDYVLTHFGADELEVLDPGTGSGAIAIALAQARPRWKITATDISPASLKVAADNAERHQVHNLQLLQSDWFAQLGGRRFDLIVSNPPYIAEQDPHLAQGDLRFEPRNALCSGAAGMDAIRHLCQHVSQVLRPGGWFFCEHGYDQKTAVHQCLVEQGFGEIVQLDDLGGQPRLSGGQIRPLSKP